MIGALMIVKEKEVIKTMDFENPLEDQYSDFFKRRYDFEDRMMEFDEK